MAMKPLRLMRVMTQRASFSSSAVKWECGVSMVQGASRGIGLEFVSFCFFYSFALLHTYIYCCFGKWVALFHVESLIEM